MAAETNSAAGKRPKQRRNAADTKEKILQAARNEFAQHGFAGARTERIVAKAGSNPRMLYHYFGSKSALYVTVLEEALGDLRSAELKIDVDHLEPLEGLMQLFDFMNRHFQTNRHLVRLLMNENVQKARYLKTSTRVSQMSSPVLRLIDDFLVRGVAAGTVRGDLDPLQVYVMMVALNQFHLANAYTLSVIFEKDLDTQQWRAGQHAAARVMVRSFLTAPAEPAST
ncbi:MAG: TetR/AcrR family transcriptional regulator [Rhizobiaceae bacterium]|nr:TetR/AcrR family transcriptional regulator [Rhizobiaceae bacterium]